MMYPDLFFGVHLESHGCLCFVVHLEFVGAPGTLASPTENYENDNDDDDDDDDNNSGMMTTTMILMMMMMMMMVMMMVTV